MRPVLKTYARFMFVAAKGVARGVVGTVACMSSPTERAVGPRGKNNLTQAHEASKPIHVEPLVLRCIPAVLV